MIPDHLALKIVYFLLQNRKKKKNAKSNYFLSHYFAEGDSKILLSPASVDLGGVCITPIEKDFEKMNKELLTEILSEVALNKNSFELIKEKLGALS